MFAIEITGNNRDFNFYPEAKEKIFPTLFGGWFRDDSGRNHPRLYNLDTDKYLAYTHHEGALDDLQIIESKGYQARVIPDPHPEIQ